MDEIIKGNNTLLPNGYTQWRKDIEQLIDTAKLHTALNVNVGTLTLYWNIGKSILQKQEQEGWGKQVIEQLSKDLISRYPDDRGYSVRNLRYMKRFASAYPDFPILQVPLAELKELPILQATLAELENEGKGICASTACTNILVSPYFIVAQGERRSRACLLYNRNCPKWVESWCDASSDRQWVYPCKGHAINNFEQTLPPPQSDLARYIFKDPYNFSFIGTVALQNELDIEKSLTSKITDFLLEMGRGFAYIGRQYHISVDGDDYYIDLLMYHLKLHCYVVVELKAVEFKPEFVSKLNFYISAVDDLVKSPEDRPTIGLLLCRTKSNKKAEFSLRGITQPMGIAQYETEKLFADVASALPQIENLENSMDDLEYDKWNKDKLHL